MHSLDFLYDLIGQYGLYAVFILVMLEGDITLLLAGVLAHSHFFGDHSFAWVLLWGTLGGCASDKRRLLRRTSLLSDRSRISFLSRCETENRTVDEQVWLSFNLFIEVYLWSAVGLLCFLWRGSHALPALSPGFTWQLLCPGSSY